MRNDFMEAIEVNKDLCSLIAMEECGELIQAISKAKRDKLNKINLSEEIADVLIGIEWIKGIYGIEEKCIYDWIDIKQKRVIDRMNTSKFI